MRTRIVVAIVVVTLAGVAAFLSFNHKTPGRSAQDIATIKDLTERIKRLEQSIAALEKAAGLAESAKRGNRVGEATFSPDGKRILTRDGKTVRIWDAHSGTVVTNLVPTPTPGPAVAVPPNTAVPPGWQPREFNGMTYYLVPLAQGRQAQAKLEFAK